MLGPDYFYHSTIRNVTAAFGSMFTNIIVQDTDSSDSTVKTIRVPLSYASGDKTLRMLLTQDKNRRENNIDVKISLPRLSFQLTNMTYDTSRKISSITNQVHKDSNGANLKQYYPVPYNLEYTVYLYVKYMDHGLQIIEQILPYFGPQYTITTKDTRLDIVRDVPVTLTSISSEDTFEGAVEEDRILQWTLTFTANAWVYPPISDAKIIKKAYTNIFDFDNEEKLYGTLVAVNPESANEDDDYTLDITRT